MTTDEILAQYYAENTLPEEILVDVQARILMDEEFAYECLSLRKLLQDLRAIEMPCSFEESYARIALRICAEAAVGCSEYNITPVFHQYHLPLSS